MKATFYKANRQTIAVCFAVLVLVSGLSACQKLGDIFDHHPGKSNKPSSYSSEVIEKWATLQARLMKNTTGVPNHGFARYYAYSGIAAWESIAPGMPGAVQLKSEWNGLTGLPQASHSKKYYWPANANAALAAINRSFFPNAGAVDKAAIDSLENALNDVFLTKTSASELNTSAQFGKLVALAVYNWAETDGYKKANDTYVWPTGAGLWKPTPPTNANPATPYWGNNRPVMKGSTKNTTPIAPPAYSATPGSPFHNMVKEVFDVSKTLTPDQVAMVHFWKDVPGTTTPGHWLVILQQVLDNANTSLSKAAIAYALTGAGINDAAISVFIAKYKHNLVRPITYIREEMGEAAWSGVIGTPAHPEYPSAHSSLSGAVAVIIQKLFGNPGTFTDHTYDYLGYAPRSYHSYIALAEEAGMSRLYGGIHYQFSIDQGLAQGKKIASNILDRCPSFGF